MPKISVIIPVYGVEKYIERCARSLFEQTLDDIEFIFVDDCTPDRSMEILSQIIDEYRLRFAEMNYVVRTERMPTNSGQAAVRRHGIQLCTGDYIIHCDSDDWVDTTMYEILYKEAVNSSADIVSCDFYLSDGLVHTPYRVNRSTSLMQGPVWNRLVRRSLYNDSRIHFPLANKAEDSALMMQLSYLSNNCAYVSKFLYYYFNNPESICHVPSVEACLKRYDDEIKNTELIIQFLKENNASDKYESDILMRKSFARDALLPLIKDKKMYKMWFFTYKEINYKYVLCSNISLRNKIGFIKRLLLRR